MNVLSLFDGMSCGQMALNRAGIKYNKYFASEIKDIGVKVTQYNYPDTIQLGDVKKINAIDLPKIDLLIGGSPCQNLSIAMNSKKRLGLEGDKSTLFYEYYRLYKEIKPKYFLLENVASMDNKDKDIITKLFGVEPIKINSALVSPQLRNRYYWTNIPNVNQPDNKNILLSDVLTNGYTDRQKARCILQSETSTLKNPLKMFHRYYSTGFCTMIFKDEQHYIDCKKHYEHNFNGMSAKQIDIKIKTENICCDVYKGIRYMNQIELEKCQTVTNGYTKILTRNQAASVLGDGWTIDVIAHILQGIKII